MKKSELITRLNNQIDCVFTLAQVKTMIEDLESETTTAFDADQIVKDIEKRIQTEIELINDSDIVDDDSVSFYLDGREINIECVEVNYAPIRRAVRDGLNVWQDSLKASFVNLG